MMETRFLCVICGKMSTGRKPRRGDGSARYPRYHRMEGKPCEGNFYFAEWVDIEIDGGEAVVVKNWGD